MSALSTANLLLAASFAALIFTSPAEAKQPRSSAQRAAFMRATPCPATGQPEKRCLGYIVDHIVPLCAGGPDTPQNMQWQTIAAAKAKDIEEMRQCRQLRAD